MELGALICKPNQPLCSQCPISKNCKSYKKKDFNLIKLGKKKINKYFILKVFEKDEKYLLIKNTKFIQKKTTLKVKVVYIIYKILIRSYILL